MKTITAGVTSAMLAVGVAGSVAAYRTQADAADVLRPAAEATATTTAQERAGERVDRVRPRVRWAPCPQDSTLEKGTCVTDVVRTVVLPAPSPTAQPTPVAPVVAAAHPGDDESDDHGDDHDSYEDDESDDHDDGHDSYEDDESDDEDRDDDSDDGDDED